MRWPWLLAAGICLLVAFVAADTTAHPGRARFSATIDRAGNLTVRLARSPASTSSPVCGCIRYQPIGGWPHLMKHPSLGSSRELIRKVPPMRGILVPAHLLRVAPVAKRYVRYDVANGEPSGWNNVPSDLGLDATVRLVYVREDATPTRATIFGHEGANVRVARQQRLTSQWFSITSSQPLYVSSPARRAVAAFSPPRGMKTTIAYDDFAADANPTLRMETAWNAAAELRQRSPDRVPLLDVLGEHVDVWSRIDRASIPFRANQWAGGELPSRTGASLSPSIASLFLPFVNQAPKGWAAYLGIHVNRGSFAARIAAWPVAVADAHLLRRPHDFEIRPHPGRLEVSVPQLTSQAVDHGDGGHRAIVIMRDLPVIDPGRRDQFGRAPFKDGVQIYERPTVGPSDAVGIFGAVSDLKVEDAAGSLVVAGRPIDFHAASTLDLRDVEGRGVLGSHFRLPPRGSGDVRIDVQGVADVRLNGGPLVKERSWLGRQVSERRITFYATILALIFSGAALIQPRRRTADAHDAIQP